MKTLNNYIKESLLDDEEDLVNDETAEIESFLEENYEIDYYKIKGKIVNVDGNATLTSDVDQLTNNGFSFGEILGNFNCSMSKIKSLKGAPKIVNGSFYCNNCNNLKTLEGCPSKVGGDFSCANCWNLKTLKGCPQKIVTFDCSNTGILSLEGCPEITIGSFDCSFSRNLNDLKGSPKNIGGNFICSNCENLKTLKGAPKKIEGSFLINHCSKLISIEGGSEEINYHFIIKNCQKLISLKGLPKKIGALLLDKTPAKTNPDNKQYIEASEIKGYIGWKG